MLSMRRGNEMIANASACTHVASGEKYARSALLEVHGHETLIEEKYKTRMLPDAFARYLQRKRKLQYETTCWRFVLSLLNVLIDLGIENKV